MHNLSQTLLDAFRKLPVAVIIAIMVLAPASPVLLAEAPIVPAEVKEDDFHFENLSKKEMKIQAAKIDAYFASKNMPLEGYGMDFVKAAQENDIPSTFMAAISVIETTGGRHTCKNPNAQNNPFGYGSCQNGFGFDSLTDAINRVSAHIGGKVEKTAHHYAGKNIGEVLKKYNCVIPTYASKIEKVMSDMNSMELPSEEGK